MKAEKKVKIKLITNTEIIKLKQMVEGTIAEELVNKLHKSYNATLIIARDLNAEIQNRGY